ncbi:MAG TPA: pitrilysin family protein [Candidatus Sulfotelmatobacter sp.]|nr:pitrilysin family protein [Candidatus Sulfotelmatobacter sp.]
MSGPAILARRPAPGPPRPYHFPGFRRARLDNGLTVITANVPGRPLMAAALLLPGGAGHEPARLGGVSLLAARALTEGTRQRDAVAFIEASERLGASLGASCDWEMLSLSLTVPRGRLEPALALLDEMLREPAFPATEVDRLREQRLNDLLQAAAQPGRRAERAFLARIYDAASPFARPLGGDEETVPRLDRAEVAARHAAHLDPAQATLILAGDMEGLDPVALAADRFGAWRVEAGVDGTTLAPVPADPAPGARGTVVVDRPASPQSEVRIGHVGLRRRIPDYHATIVLTTMLGGLFNSRLQRLLREEKGYTYHISAGFDFRRSPGPFTVRTAVQTEVTAPAVDDALGVLRRLTADAPTPAELAEAREFLIGVFPLRFESPEQVAGAIAGLVAQDLPDDELDRYRPAVAAVTASDVVAAADHIRPAEAVALMVGDAARVVPELEKAGLGPVEVVPAA